MAPLADKNASVYEGGGSSGNRGSTTGYRYDPATGTWVPVTATNSSGSSNSSNQSTNNQKTNTTNTNSGSSQVDSQTKAEKEYIEIEFNTLTGELNLRATEKTIRIKVNDTVKVEGLGNYLSGLYFVTAIKRTIDGSSGYSHTLTLLKNGFGSSIKQAKAEEQKPRQEEVPKTSPDYKVGDIVKIVAEDAVYSNASDGVKVPAWVKKKTHTIDGISSDKTRVRLKEIWSWIYVKYIQKV